MTFIDDKLEPESPRGHFEIPVEAIEDRSLDFSKFPLRHSRTARSIFFIWDLTELLKKSDVDSVFFFNIHRSGSTRQSPPARQQWFQTANLTSKGDGASRRRFQGTDSTSHPVWLVPCLAHMTTECRDCPGSGHVGAGVHERMPTYTGRRPWVGVPRGRKTTLDHRSPCSCSLPACEGTNPANGEIVSPQGARLAIHPTFPQG